jgi:hypothetical protein
MDPRMDTPKVISDDSRTAIDAAIAKAEGL